MKNQEVLGPFGYINDEHRHVLISIRDPSLLNAIPQGGDILQFALTIDTAIALRAELNAFLTAHGVSVN